MNGKSLIELIADLKSFFSPKNQKLVPVKVRANNNGNKNFSWLK